MRGSDAGAVGNLRRHLKPPRETISDDWIREVRFCRALSRFPLINVNEMFPCILSEETISLKLQLTRTVRNEPLIFPVSGEQCESNRGSIFFATCPILGSRWFCINRFSRRRACGIGFVGPRSPVDGPVIVFRPRLGISWLEKRRKLNFLRGKVGRSCEVNKK